MTRIRVPMMLQAGPSDCGAACMAMLISTLKGHRISVTEMDDLRTLADRDGMSALTVRRGLESRGLTVRTLRVPEARTLISLPVPAIAVLTESHFVVVERATKRFVEVCDPAIGKKRLSWAEFAGRFAGIVIAFKERPRPHRDGLRSALARRAHASVPFRFAKAWPAELRRAAFAVLSLSLALELASVAAVQLLRQLLNGHDPGLAAVLVISLGMVTLVQLMGQIGRGLLVARCNNDGEALMRRSTFTKILSFDFNYFQYRTPGHLNALMANTRQVNDAFFTTVVDGGTSIATGTASLALLMAIDPLAGLTVSTLVCLVFVGCVIARRTISSAAKVEFEQRVRIAGVSDEMFRAVEGLRGIDARVGTEAIWARHADNLSSAARLSRRWAQAAEAVTLGSTRVLQVGVITVVVLQSHAHLMAGSLVAVVSYSAMAFTPLLDASRRTLRWGEIDVLLAQLSDVWERRGSSAIEPPAASTEAKALTLNGLQVGFGVRPALIKGATLTVHAGERVGISAASGAGKSTLLRAVAGMIQARAGTVTVDGVGLETASKRGFKVAYVPQDVTLLTGSIAENLRIGAREATDEELWQACRQAQIADDLAAFPKGLDTLLMAGGSGLSGGQRQRIAVARALLTRPWLLILDEATSALDYATEQRLFRDLPAMAMLVVSHRVEVMRAMDRVFLLEDGRLREQGLGDTPAKPSVVPVELADATH